MQDLSKHETDLHIKGQDWEHWSNLNRLKLEHGKKRSGAALHYKGNAVIYTIGLEILILIILEYHWTDVL